MAAYPNICSKQLQHFCGVSAQPIPINGIEINWHKTISEDLLSKAIKEKNVLN